MKVNCPLCEFSIDRKTRNVFGDIAVRDDFFRHLSSRHPMNDILDFVFEQSLEKFKEESEYITRLIKKESVIENDPHGAEIPGAYYKTIKCMKCSSEIMFYSGYSGLNKGLDVESCSECGTIHAFIRLEENGMYVFKVKVK